jgi:dTDP-glucose 4,6-dehydratase
MAHHPGHHPTLAGTRVLVTGGGGFIGSHIVHRLVTHGARVTALGRHEGRLADLAMSDCFEVVKCDITDDKATIAAVESCAPQIVYHLAAMPDAAESHSQAHNAIRTNAIGTLNVLEGLRRGGGGLFVYGDSSKCYGDAGVPYHEALPARPLSSYAIGKLAGWTLSEMYGRLYSIDVVSVRPTLIYGPRQGRNLISFVIDTIARGKHEIVLDGGQQTRDPLFVDDAVDAFMLLADHVPQVSGHVINIGGGREYSVMELAGAVADAMGARLKIVSAAERMRSTEMLRSYCDNTEAKALLGWQPQTDLHQGLRLTVEHDLDAPRSLPDPLYV